MAKTRFSSGFITNSTGPIDWIITKPFRVFSHLRKSEISPERSMITRKICRITDSFSVSSFQEFWNVKDKRVISKPQVGHLAYIQFL